VEFEIKCVYVGSVSLALGLLAYFIIESPYWGIMTTFLLATFGIYAIFRSIYFNSYLGMSCNAFKNTLTDHLMTLLPAEGKKHFKKFIFKFGNKKCSAVDFLNKAEEFTGSGSQVLMFRNKYLLFKWITFGYFGIVIALYVIIFFFLWK
jgi:hypothetical protein